jgi:hypothetical protein
MSIIFAAPFLALLDFIAYAYLGRWLVYSLLSLVLIMMMRWRSDEGRGALLWTTGLFLLQDFARHGRAFVSLIILIPLCWAIISWRDTLLYAQWILLSLGIIVFIFVENNVFYAFTTGATPCLAVTMLQILINLCVGYVVLWNMLGSRSSSIAVGGRKVWTPNRKDAS